MIQFFLDKDNAYTMRNYLGYRGESIRQLFDVRSYQELPGLKKIDCSTMIFTDLECLTEGQRDSLIVLVDHLSAAEQGPLIYNHPAKVQSRYNLLRTLFEKGINPHNVYLLTEALDQIRFPVFLRHKDHHTGPLTPLLYDQKQIKTNVQLLRLSGHHGHDLMIVEFADTRDENGIYKKFSALKVGSQLIPRLLGYDDHWSVKANGTKEFKKTKAYLNEFGHFMHEFPHKQWAEEVFNLAGIDYGRIDYGMHDNQLVAWEINLNPDYGTGRARKSRDDLSEIKEMKTFNHQELREVFKALSSKETVEIDVPFGMIETREFSTHRSGKAKLKSTYKNLTMRFPLLKRVLEIYRKLLRGLLSRAG